MKNFVMIGASGFIAPKHFEAIRKTNNNLVAAYDISETAGKIDSYFKNCKYFFNFQEFKRYLNSVKRKINIDYLVICTPNYLHYKYIEFGLKNKLNVICEKPLVLNCRHLLKIISLEKKYKKDVYCIMQLRLNNKLIKLKNKIHNTIKKNPNKLFEAKINYITFRGDWFLKSWKGDILKSGGLTTNIGIHLFDLLCWFFGKYESFKVNVSNSKENKGFLYFKNAKVEWLISISSKYLKNTKKGNYAKRELILDDKKIELSDNFTNLHIKSYSEILKKRGFGSSVVSTSISLTEKLRK